MDIVFVPAHPNNYSLQRVTPTFLVLHGTGGTFRGDQTWAQNPHARASYHYLVSKGGEVVQMVEDRYIAFHAGASEWSKEAAERRGFPFSEHSSWTDLNRHSIGVGLESLNRRDEVYPEAQLQALAELVRSRYGRIPPHRILTHEMISAPRKVDPVNFPLEQWLQLLAGEQLEPAPAPFAGTGEPRRLGRYRTLVVHGLAEGPIVVRRPFLASETGDKIDVDFRVEGT
jgi:N-acetyl-anhydromuramyl-L-alanine amidase AmpD